MTPPASGLRRALAPALLALAFLTLQLAATWATVPGRLSILDLGFGFGGYVRSLVEGGRFAACLEPACARAARMPLLPLLYAAFAHASHDQRLVALMKDVAVTLPAGWVVFLGWDVHRRDHPWAGRLLVAALALLCLSPPFLKHAGGVTYEEGVLACLFPAWLYGLAALASVERGAGAPPRKVAQLAGGVVVLGALCFLTKDSMALVLALSLAVGGWTAWSERSVRLAVFILAIAACVAAWPIRNGLVAGRFTPMTSYDGANLERGFSADGLKLYPAISLDRIYDHPAVTLPNGVRVPLEARPRTFPNEWVWNDHYRDRAVRWLTSHPTDALRFSAKKAEVFLVEVRKTPFVDPQGREAPARRILTTIGLIEGRVMQVAFILAAAWLLWRGGRRERLVAGAAIAGAVAYAAPYLIGFAYERHVTVWLAGLTLASSVLAAEALRLRRARGP